MHRISTSRHSGERRNPGAAGSAHVALDTGLRRYDVMTGRFYCPAGAEAVAAAARFFSVSFTAKMESS